MFLIVGSINIFYIFKFENSLYNFFEFANNRKKDEFKV